MHVQRHSSKKIEFNDWKKDVDELCQKVGVPQVIDKFDDQFWLDRFQNSDTPGDIVMEWSMKKTPGVKNS
jgi:hypothetical protein